MLSPALLPAPAAAAWRAVGPGMAVGEARTGSATLSVECHRGAIVLGTYNSAWPFAHEDRLDLVVDGTAFPLRMYGYGDRILLSDTDSPGGSPGLSAAVIDALRSGREARLSGAAVAGEDPRAVTFGLGGSDRAIDPVVRQCG